MMGKHRKVKGKLTLKFCSCISMDVDEFPEENKPYSPRQVDGHDEQVSQSVDSVHYNLISVDSWVSKLVDSHLLFCGDL